VRQEETRAPPDEHGDGRGPSGPPGAGARRTHGATRWRDSWSGASPGKRWLAAGALLLTLFAVALLTLSSGGGGATGTQEGASETAVAQVARRALSARVQASGTLGYSCTYSVVNQAQGIYTALPRVGDVIAPGEVLYRVRNRPIVLLRGTTPAYRALSQGIRGPDVRQLNTSLVALGYASPAGLDPGSAQFGAETAQGVRRLQAAIGARRSGALELGAVVFEPGRLRITAVGAQLGTPAGPGSPVADATSPTRQVSVQLDAGAAPGVKQGDRVRITLPSNRTIPGVVRSVGRVASTPDPNSSEQPKIPLTIAPKRPGATGHLDQAPVQVEITTETVPSALVVPITALLALGGGGYAVERVDPRNEHQLVAVELGLFDDADGLVQVKGSGLEAGQRVVVPAT
jgi:peptidoglycan hydrolase-like protein with peptidoglycan-binding domain